MNEGHIPIDINDLPIDTVPLDESAVYTGILKRATVSPRPDKNGYAFAAIQLEVTEGPYEGRTVMGNYLPLPVSIHEDMSKAERIRAMDKSVAFARFCRAFRVKGTMPPVSHADPTSLADWQEWITQFYDNTGKFTIRNQEFPEGSGRLRSGVSDFVI